MFTIIFEVIKKIIRKRKIYVRQITPIFLSVTVIVLVECVNSFSSVISKYEESEYVSFYISENEKTTPVQPLNLNYNESDHLLCNSGKCIKQLCISWIEGKTENLFCEQKVSLNSCSSGYFYNLEPELTAGRFISETDETLALPVAVVSADLLKNDGDIIGKQIKIRADDNSEYEFEVIGAYSDDSPKDENFVYVNHSYLLSQGFISDNDQSQLSYLVPNKKSAALSNLLRNYYDLNYGVGAVDISLENSAQDSGDIAVNAILVIIKFFLMISFIIGNIGILTMSLIEVSRRTKEFGIKQAIGVTRSYIFLEITAESVFLSMIGTFFGSLTGIVIGNLINFCVTLKFESVFSSFEFILPVKMILITSAVAYAISFIFSQIPVFTVFKMNITDAIRSKD